MTTTADDLTPVEMRALVGYFGHSAFDRRVVTTEVWGEHYEAEWSLADFMREIAQAANQVPDGADATVELAGGYDETTKLTISYTMPENDDEYAERVARMKAWARQRVRAEETNERSVYEQLKAKYG